MKIGIAAALLGALTLAGCQTAGGGGGTWTKIKPPDTTRWAGRRIDERTIVYTCLPLACPEKTSVKVRTTRSPTRTPDPTALEKLAKETFPTNIEASSMKLETATQGYVKLDLIGTKVGAVRDFPAVTVELKKTGEGRPMFGRRVFLFAGNTLIDVYAVSHARELAHRYADEFIAGFDIDDRPPPS